jgi:hypothetical protein
LFYLDGPGGTGKTFLLNTLIDLVESKSISTIVLASSGVAALLLEGSQTLHAAFEIPIGVEREAECGVENCQAT